MTTADLIHGLNVVLQVAIYWPDGNTRVRADDIGWVVHTNTRIEGTDTLVCIKYQGVQFPVYTNINHLEKRY